MKSSVLSGAPEREQRLCGRDRLLVEKELMENEINGLKRSWDGCGVTLVL